MTCKDILENMSNYLDFELNKDEAKNFDKHLETCSSCAKELEGVKLTLKNLKNIQDIEPPKELKASIMQKIYENSSTNKPSSEKIVKLRGFKKYYYVAAIFIFILVFGYYSKLVKVENRPVEQGISTLSSQELPSASPNSRSALTLEDVAEPFFDTEVNFNITIKDMAKVQELAKEVFDSGYVQFTNYSDDYFQLILSKRQILDLFNYIKYDYSQLSNVITIDNIDELSTFFQEFNSYQDSFLIKFNFYIKQ